MPLRIRLLALVDGAGSGAYLAAVSILLLANHTPAQTGAAVALGSLGRILSLLWAGLLTRGGADRTSARRAYLSGIILMTFGAIAGVYYASAGSVATVAVLGVLSGAGNNLTSTLAATARKGQMTSFYPTLIVGGGAGAAYATYLIQNGSPLVWVYALLALQLAEPLLIRPYQKALVPRPKGLLMASDTLRAATLSSAAYGPLAVYAVLVTSSVGPQYVGLAMVAYSCGAAAAAAVDRLLERHVKFWQHDSWRTVTAVAAAGVLTWALASSLPGLLAGRLAAGVLMFLAQGMLLRSRFESASGSEARVASTSAGLGIGAGLGGVAATLLAQSFGIPAMAVLLAAATLALGFVRDSTETRT